MRLMFKTNIVITLSHLQDAGLLLRKPWPRESDTKGKAVAFIMVGIALPQLILGSCLGFIISAFGTTRVVLVVAFLGECFATLVHCFSPPSLHHVIISGVVGSHWQSAFDV